MSSSLRSKSKDRNHPMYSVSYNCMTDDELVQLTESKKEDLCCVCPSKGGVEKGNKVSKLSSPCHPSTKEQKAGVIPCCMWIIALFLFLSLLGVLIYTTIKPRAQGNNASQLDDLIRRLGAGESDRQELASLLNQTSQKLNTISAVLDELHTNIQHLENRTVDLEEGLLTYSFDADLENTRRNTTAMLERLSNSTQGKSGQCGGIQIVQSEGLLDFEDANINTNKNRTCTWTLRTRSFEKMRLIIIESNFNTSMARLRITPMWIFRKSALPGRTPDATTLLSVVENSGVSVEGPVVFLELLPPSNSNLTSHPPPRFRLLFYGEGDPQANSRSLFTHYHYGQEAAGRVRHTPYKDNEVVSWVIRPSSGDKKVILNQKYLDIEISNNCTHDYMEVYAVDSASRWGHADKNQRMCGNSSTWTSSISQSAFIGMFFSDGSIAGRGFEYVYEIK